MGTRQQISARQLRGMLRERGISQHEFAVAAGLAQPTVSAVLRGDITIGAERKERFERAIESLRLTEPTTPKAGEVIFEVATATDSE